MNRQQAQQPSASLPRAEHEGNAAPARPAPESEGSSPGERAEAGSAQPPAAADRDPQGRFGKGNPFGLGLG